MLRKCSTNKKHCHYYELVPSLCNGQLQSFFLQSGLCVFCLRQQYPHCAATAASRPQVRSVPNLDGKLQKQLGERRQGTRPQLGLRRRRRRRRQRRLLAAERVGRRQGAQVKRCAGRRFLHSAVGSKRTGLCVSSPRSRLDSRLQELQRDGVADPRRVGQLAGGCSRGAGNRLGQLHRVPAVLRVSGRAHHLLSCHLVDTHVV